MNMDVSENSGTPKSSLLIGFSILNHPFWGTSIFGNAHIFASVVDSKVQIWFFKKLDLPWPAWPTPHHPKVVERMEVPSMVEKNP